MIQLYHVHKNYGNYQALVDVSLKVEKGEFLYITGPSGAGKTTLLNIVFCGVKADQGQILVGGKNILKLNDSDIPYYRREIGVVFQDFKLLPRKTVYENIAFAQRVIGVSSKEIKRKVWAALKMVGLSHKKDLLPPRLSGGEQQRVSIARALINEPSIILADEPTGNLDYDISMEIMKLFEDASAKGATVIVATHNREILKTFPHKVVKLNRGKVVEE
ncbi:MAG: cell division ATP-binding protein FtsE [Nitrospinae bacterium]|nr:cell division ATP-binding protein FtsE [Nitrospinota bacterium]